MVIMATNTTGSIFIKLASAIWTVCILFILDGSIPTVAVRIRIGAGANVNVRPRVVAHIISPAHRIHAIGICTTVVLVTHIADIEFGWPYAFAHTCGCGPVVI